MRAWVYGGGPIGDAHLAAASARRWAGDRPIVLGGDFNLRDLALEGFVYAGGHRVDHVFVRGLRPAPEGAEVLDRGRLSDHAPVAVTIAPAPAPRPAATPST